MFGVLVFAVSCLSGDIWRRTGTLKLRTLRTNDFVWYSDSATIDLANQGGCQVPGREPKKPCTVHEI